MSVKSQQWINEAGTFYPVSGDTRLLASPGDGVFVVVESATPMMKRIGLNRIGDKFDFDFKLYELGTDPIIRLVKKTCSRSISSARSLSTRRRRPLRKGRTTIFCCG